MKFEEVLQNLRDNKILTRKAWKGKWLEMRNEKLVLIIERGNTLRYYYREVNLDNEDILADDWEIENKDNLDIKQFYLSVNDLKNLGVNQQTIEELIETQPLMGAIELSPRDEWEEKKNLLGRNL